MFSLYSYFSLSEYVDNQRSMSNNLLKDLFKSHITDIYEIVVNYKPPGMLCPGKAGSGNKENAGAVLTAFTPLGGNGETGGDGAVVIPNSSITPGQ